MKNSSSILLFLLGLLGTFRVNLIGRIGISEIFVFALAPIVFIQDQRILKRDGFMPFIWLALATCVACVVSSVWNHTLLPNMLRGFASPYALFSGIVVIHRLLRKNMGGLKWLALGFGLSAIFTFFISQVDTGSVGAARGQNEAMEAIFRMYRLTPIVLCPIAGWYYRIPILYSVGAPLLAAGYFLQATASGRSTALFFVATAGLCFLGRKSVRGIRIISKNFILFILAAGMAVFAFKQVYQTLARNGTLGEVVRTKYEKQTRGGTGMIQLLMGGRTDFFSGLYCGIRRPLLGYGPWAIDYEGLVDEFLIKYGADDDLSASSIGKGLRFVPAHSHIIGFFVWYGIVGFVFWFSALVLFLNVFRKYAMGIPVWYGYVCAWLPTTCWAILFSPFYSRMEAAALIAVCLFMKGAYLGKIRPPIELMGFNRNERRQAEGRFAWIMRSPRVA